MRRWMNYSQENAQLELVNLCDEIEKEQLLSTLDIPNITFEIYDPQDPQGGEAQDPQGGEAQDNFEHVLNFWCDTPWWWDDDLAVKLQMGPPIE